MGTYNDFRVTADAGLPGQVSRAMGSKGAVATAARQATELAIQILEDGGNAFDAAFATAFALAIYHPQAGNLGGGGYLLFQERGATPKVFNYREQAPHGAKREAFLLPDGSPDPDKTAFGPTSVCVPGTVKAFFELHRRYGKRKASDLLLAVAQRSDEGAVLTQYECDCLNRLRSKLALSPEAQRIYVRGQPFQAGDVLPNAPLAATLRLLAQEGERAFYQGALAEKMVADLSNHGGFLSMQDLASYTLKEVDPIQVSFAGRTVWSVPPEGGGAMLLEILGILDQPDFQKQTYGSPEYHHYLAQAAKHAFIHRMEYLGDVDLSQNNTYAALFNPASLMHHFAAIDPTRDMPTCVLAPLLRAPKDAGKHTTHFAIVDAEGNAVSNSYTMNLRYGSKWAVAGAGFLLNGSIDSFSFVEGKENYFGVPGSEPNLFAPGKRPASNMAPVLVTTEHGIEAALGTPGGPTIPTTLAHVLAGVLLHHQDPASVITASRLHHQAWPDMLSHEPGFEPAALLASLAAMGYTLKDKHERIADVQGIFCKAGVQLAISDFRREGCALAR